MIPFSDLIDLYGKLQSMQEELPVGLWENDDHAMMNTGFETTVIRIRKYDDGSLKLKQADYRGHPAAIRDWRFGEQEDLKSCY